MDSEPRLKTTARVRGTTSAAEASARAMRRDLTPTERILWQALRQRRLAGLRFRCQYPLGPFILDFCCPERRLVVELDGAGHREADQLEYDELRTQHLQSYGYRALRFWNDEVLHDLRGVLDRIREGAEQCETTDGG
jgi:very-short-patch-repair endonuclease